MKARKSPVLGAPVWARACRVAAISALLGPLIVFAGGASGLGLGEIVQQSALGEPFRATIPVLVNDDDLIGDDLAPECFRLVASESQRATDLPQIVFGRATLARNARGVFVIVSSNTVANDPAVSFTVQAGCKLQIRHEYTVLLDPPVIVEPMTEAEPTTNVAPAPPTRTSRAPREETRRLITAAPRAHSSTAPRSSAVAKRAPSMASPTAEPQATAGAVAPPRSEAGPRLRVSRGSQDLSTEPGASDIARGKSDEEIRRDVEAETIVLQRRIAELSATLERMEADLQRATAARDAAVRAAKAPPPAPPSWEPSPWLIAQILLVVILVLALLLVRARRAANARSLDVPSVAGANALSAASREVDFSDDDSLGVPARPGHVAQPMPPLRADNDSGPPLSGTHPSDEDSFDDDLLRYVEQTSEYSVLERRHPKIVASIVRDWGKPKVIGYLRDVLVSPRRASGGFSREAVSDLILLQGIAMERAGYAPEESPWQVDIDKRRRGEG